MRLTWHIVLKDLTRLRLPMVFWAALFLSEFAVGVRFLNAGAMSYPSFGSLQILDMLLYGLRVAIGYLLVAALLFDDPLVGSTAFWPTRPISGSRLMGAKLLTCLLIFGLLPILVTLAWWLYCGYGIPLIWQASLDSVGSQAIPVALGLLIAALTGSAARFLVWTLLVAAAVGISFVTFVKPPGTHLFFHGMDVVVDSSGATFARLQTLCILAIAGWSMVVAHQFFTRRLVRSLALLILVTGLVCAEAAWWPLALKDRSRDVTASAVGAALDDRVSIHTSKDASLHIEQDPGMASGTVVFGTVEVEGAPIESLMRYDKPAFEWHWADGTNSRAQGALVGSAYATLYQLQAATPHKEPSASAWEQSASYKLMLRDGKPVAYQDFIKENPSNRVWDYYVEVPRPDGIRMLTDPPSCTIVLQGDLLQPELSPEIPLVRGNGWAAKGEGFRIASRKWNESRKMLEVSVVEHRASIGGLFSAYSYSNWLNAENTYFTVNRRLGESAASVSFNGFNFSIRIATVAIAWRRLEFVGPSNRVTLFPVREYGNWMGPSYEDWFADASLGRVVETVTGRFSRKVTIDRFSVAPDIFSKAP